MEKYTEIDLNADNSAQSDEAGSESQLATAYIIYMIVGSYFKSCRPQSQIRINSLYVHYSEMRINNQFSVERKVDWDFSEKFSEYLPVFEGSACDVYIREAGDRLCIEFDTGIERITASVDKEGQYEFTLTDA